MRKIVKRLAVSLAGLICSIFVMSTCQARTLTQAGADLSSERMSLKSFLQTWDNNKARSTRYIAAFRDLNGDGVVEAIVYLVSDAWCGSGGCVTLVLSQVGGSWKTVTKVTITRPPIRVLSDTSNGWHSLAVWVQGGGILTGYEAELRFDGKSYPTNPTVPPAQRVKKAQSGDVVVSTINEALPLYD